MLSIVIPTLNAADTLEQVLDSLQGFDQMREIIVADGGSDDDTCKLAIERGARVIKAPIGRGQQLAAGADAAGGNWLLFLHADTELGGSWRSALTTFIEDEKYLDRAAVFSFALNDPHPAARRLEKIVRWRSRVLGLPYGDQGLLISRHLYNEIGGFRALPLYEDVDIIRRIGRKRLVLLDVPAVTSAARYQRSGYVLRPLRNLACLSLYLAGLPPRFIGRFYQ